MSTVDEAQAGLIAGILARFAERPDGREDPFIFDAPPIVQSQTIAMHRDDLRRMNASYNALLDFAMLICGKRDVEEFTPLDVEAHLRQMTGDLEEPPMPVIAAPPPKPADADLLEDEGGLEERVQEWPANDSEFVAGAYIDAK